MLPPHPRSTYKYDVSTGGRPYERFWGGTDPIARDVEQENNFFNEVGTSEAAEDPEEMQRWYDDNKDSDGTLTEAPNQALSPRPQTRNSTLHRTPSLEP